MVIYFLNPFYLFLYFLNMLSDVDECKRVVFTKQQQMDMEITTLYVINV